MFDPRFPWLAVGALTVVSGVVALYYSAVVAGWYKSPLLARCRMYGENPPYYPLCRFLLALGLWSLLACTMLDALTQTTAALANATYLPVIFLALAGVSLGAALIVRRSDHLRSALPLWHAELLRDTTRLERRLIAFAWLRIPRRMRWRLSSDRASWRAWVDTVRITVIYGAQDSPPAPPWS